MEKKLAILPEYDHFDTFGPDENPVEFVMKQLSSVYPEVYQEMLPLVLTSSIALNFSHSLLAPVFVGQWCHLKKTSQHGSYARSGRTS